MTEGKLNRIFFYLILPLIPTLCDSDGKKRNSWWQNQTMEHCGQTEGEIETQSWLIFGFKKITDCGAASGRSFLRPLFLKFTFLTKPSFHCEVFPNPVTRPINFSPSWIYRYPATFPFSFVSFVNRPSSMFCITGKGLYFLNNLRFH